MRKAINDALATALEVRLLKRYDFDGLGSVILRLNPERCKLLAAKLVYPFKTTKDNSLKTGNLRILRLCLALL